MGQNGAATNGGKNSRVPLVQDVNKNTIPAPASDLDLRGMCG